MAEQSLSSPLDLSCLAFDIGFRARSARAVARQIEEVMPDPSTDQYLQANEAGYLLAAVVDLLDMVSHSAEQLEVALKTKHAAPAQPAN